MKNKKQKALAGLAVIGAAALAYWVMQDSGIDTSESSRLSTEEAQSALHHKGITSEQFAEKLLQSAAAGELDIVTLLVYAKPEIQTHTDDKGNSALHLAAENGHAEICEFLLKNGSEIRVLNKHAQTPLHLAAIKGQANCVQLLVKKGCLPDEGDMDSYTPLMHAAKNGHKDCITILHEAGATSKQKYAGESSPLMLAAAAGHVECVETLISHGVNLNAKDSKKYTALMHAAEAGHTNCVKILLAAGASTAADALTGKSALELSEAHAECHQVLAEYMEKHREQMAAIPVSDEEAESMRKSSLNQSLVNAILNHDNEAVLSCLNAGASPDSIGSDGTPAIISAVEKNQPDTLKILLDKYATPEAKSASGEMALHLAARTGAVECLKLLLQAHASLHVKVWEETPLFAALEHKHDACAVLLIEAGADIAAKNSSGKCPVYLAAENGRTAPLEALLKRKADPNTDYGSVTPLMIAAANRHAACVQLLLQAGADVNKRSSQFYTALHYAAESGCVESIRFLVEGGAELNHTEASHKPPLHLAIMRENTDAVNEFLRNHADPNLRDNIGHTPLHAAAFRGYTAGARALVEHGAQLNATIENGYTPLHAAAENNFTECLTYLLEAGADCLATTDNGETPLDFAVKQTYNKCPEILATYMLRKKGIDINSQESMMQVFNEDNAEILQLILLAKRSEADIANTEKTLFLEAAKQGKQHCFAMLIDHVADINAVDGDGATAIHLAASAGHVGIIEELLRHHINPQITDKEGLTALARAQAAGHSKAIDLLKMVDMLISRGYTPANYNAALLDFSRRGDHQTVTLLLRLGADVKHSDTEGKTALHYAATSRHVTCAKKLMEAGADPNARDANHLTPLMHAIDTERSSVIRALIAGGADAVTANVIESPVVRAIQKNKEECFQIILDAGIDINHRDSLGNTLLHIALRENKEGMIKILLKRGADVNVVLNGDPLFHTAIKSEQDDCIRALMYAENLDYYARNAQGENAMHVAAQYGNIEVMVFLAKKAQIALNVKDARGRTPLHHAAIGGRARVVTQMVNIKFINVNEIDDEKHTPLYYAKQMGNTQCTNILRDAGGVEDLKELD